MGAICALLGAAIRLGVGCDGDRSLDGRPGGTGRPRSAPEIYGYFRRGAGRGLSAAEAATSWDRLRLRAHVLRDVSVCDTSTTVLGTPVGTPVLVAPSTLQRRADREGEAATARGVAHL